MPIPFSSTGARTTSNVPAQSLTIMNDPFIHEIASRWGKSIANDQGSREEKLASIYWSTFARPPTQNELDSGLQFLDEMKGNDVQAWASFVHVLFSSKEFLYLI